jgi:hypothetical protein
LEFVDRELGDGNFFVHAEDRAHGVADFAKRGIRFDSFDDVGHQIFFAPGSFSERE